MWQSNISSDQCEDDDGAIVHIFNENTSWHGHTMMSIEYNNTSGNHTYWGLSFQPAQEGEPMKSLLVTGVPATIIDRTTFQDPTAGITGPISKKVLSYPISAQQRQALEQKIQQEKELVNRGTVSYATVGVPVSGVFTPGYRDTCYSWVIRVLREVGIISSAWVLTRWLSMAPAMTDLFGKDHKEGFSG